MVQDRLPSIRDDKLRENALQLTSGSRTARTELLTGCNPPGCLTLVSISESLAPDQTSLAESACSPVGAVEAVKRD